MSTERAFLWLAFCFWSLVDVLVLDNTYSWTKSKTVRYSIEIISSEEGDNQLLSSALEVKDNDEPITDFDS